MKRTAGMAAWIAVFSVPLVGCYSSVLVDPAGPERERLYSNTVEYVVTKDSTNYQFLYEPVVDSKGRLNGMAEVREDTGVVTKQVSIPLSDVATISVKKFQPVRTTLAVLATTGLVAAIAGAIYLSSHPMFDGMTLMGTTQ